VTPRVQVFAVVRVDTERTPPPSERGAGVPFEWLRRAELAGISVHAVLPTLEEAASETDRLNELNRDKGATYFWMATRYYPEGRGEESS
jgi:hypothetical protein